MIPRDKRKAVTAIRRACQSQGLDLIEVPEHGKGSHLGLLFTDTVSGETYSITLAGTREISQGVQRATLARLKVVSEYNAIARTLYEIIKTVFTSKN